MSFCFTELLGAAFNIGGCWFPLPVAAAVAEAAVVPAGAPPLVPKTPDKTI